MRLGYCTRHGYTSACPECEIERLRRELAEAKREAEYLAKNIHKQYYSDVTGFELCDSVSGVITQIDNMVAGISHKLEQAEKELADSKEKSDAFERDYFNVFNRLKCAQGDYEHDMMVMAKTNTDLRYRAEQAEKELQTIHSALELLSSWVLTFPKSYVQQEVWEESNKWV